MQFYLSLQHTPIMMKSCTLLISILCFVASSSCTQRMNLGSADTFRENIAVLLQNKLHFSDDTVPAYEGELTDTTPRNSSEYDFIVIGAGSAGATIASRLSEDTNNRVLLIDAGIKEYPLMDVPLMAAALEQSPQINWMFETESSDKFCRGFTDSKCKWPRSKVMGGCSVFNYMIATRGHRKDFNGWARSTGDASWSHDQMLQYLMKLEKYEVRGLKLNETLHNRNGPLYIGSAPYHTKIDQIFIEANEELGVPLYEYNGQEQMGTSYFQLNIHDGERWSVNRAYLHPAKSRKNLILTRESHVNRILIDEETHTAYGVQFTKADQTIEVKAIKEIILSAGAINSPQILMLSGIGPAQHLNDLGIRVIKDAPVGKNLMDHISYAGLVFKMNDSTTYEDPNLFDPNDTTIERYLNERNGLLALGTGFNALSYFNVDNQKLVSNEANIELLFSPGNGLLNPSLYTNLGVQDRYKQKLIADNKNYKQNMWAAFPMLMHPKSRGKLLLRSKDPKDKPKIYPNYLDHPEDVRTLIRGIRAVIKLSQTRAFQRYASKLYDTPLDCEQFKFDSDDYWECAIRTYTVTIYHPSGTCKMGKETDKTAVVDSKLKVIGIQRLRVADASIMPKIVSAHPHIPIVAIGEKISDEIKREWNTVK